MQTHTQYFSQVADIGDSGLAAGGPIQGGIPEKFQVTRQDGSMDVEASSMKLAEAYSHLSKRMGAGDSRPISPAEYQIAVPEALQGEWNPAEDKALQDFLGKAHKVGFSQDQIDFALDTYHATASRLLESTHGLTEEQCTAELRKGWQTDDQYNAGMRDASRAAMAYAGRDGQALMDKYGNDPALVRALARVGFELREDRPISAEVSYARPSVHSLISSEAYANPKHPEHASVSQQVADYYASIHKGDAR